MINTNTNNNFLSLPNRMTKHSFSHSSILWTLALTDNKSLLAPLSNKIKLFQINCIQIGRFHSQLHPILDIPHPEMASCCFYYWILKLYSTSDTSLSILLILSYQVAQKVLVDNVNSYRVYLFFLKIKLIVSLILKWNVTGVIA